MILPQRARRLLTLLSSAVIDQAMLSAANFVVGLLLIRYVTDLQYGYYVLAFNAITLMGTLQGTFIGTPLMIRMPSLNPGEQREWIGSLLRDQHHWSTLGTGVALAGAVAAWTGGKLDHESGWVMLAAIAAMPAALYREFFRSVLAIYKRPIEVLVADAVYVVGLLVGAGLAVLSPMAAVVALLSSAVAAMAGAWMLRRSLGPGTGFNPFAERGRLAQIARLGAWAAAGGVIHWTFNQGYTFLAAATLDVAAVAALAAARLLMMPVNLISSGVQRQLIPIASGWLHTHGAGVTLRRLLGFSAALGGVAFVYALVVWFVRDWIFVDLMRKNFVDRDRLVLLWSAIFLITAVRDPVMYLAILRERFKILTALTLVCAALSLTVSYWGMLEYGAIGALFGILAGELLNFCGVVVLAWRELRWHAQPTPEAA